MNIATFVAKQFKLPDGLFATRNDFASVFGAVWETRIRKGDKPPRWRFWLHAQLHDLVPVDFFAEQPMVIEAYCSVSHKRYVPDHLVIHDPAYTELAFLIADAFKKVSGKEVPCTSPERDLIERSES